MLNIRHHLLTVHKLTKSCLEFQSLVAVSSREKLVKRLRKFKTITSERQDLIGQFDTTMSSEHISNTPTPSPVSYNDVSHHLNHSTYDISDKFEFESSADSDIEIESDISICTPIDLPHFRNDTSYMRFIDCEPIIQEFHSFLLTKEGGGRRNTPIKGDLSSFRIMSKELGWDNI